MNSAPESQAHVDLGEDIYCPSCTYNLHKAPGDRCPECGYALEGLRATESRIPWVHRHRLGRCRAFWQTVELVTFRNRRFCEEYARDVSYRDARRFQWVCVLHVWLAAIATTVFVYATMPPPPEAMNLFQQMMATGTWPQGPTQWDRAIEELWPAALQHLCLLLFLAAATGAPSYFFHPRALSIQRQNSAVALSYYLCSPLAYLIAAPLLVALVHAAPLTFDLSVSQRTSYILGFAVLLGGLSWWDKLVKLTRRAMPQLTRRYWTVAIGVPVASLALAALTLLAIPSGIVAVLVVVDSLA